MRPKTHPKKQMQPASSKSTHLSPQPALSLPPSAAHQKPAQNRLKNLAPRVSNITPKIGEYLTSLDTYIYRLQIFPHFGRIFTSRPTPNSRPIHPKSAPKTTPSLRPTNPPSPKRQTPLPQTPSSLHPHRQIKNPPIPHCKQTTYPIPFRKIRPLFALQITPLALPKPHRPLLTPSRAIKRGVTPSSPTAGRAALPLPPPLCDTGEES